MAKRKRGQGALPLGDEIEQLNKLGFAPGLVDRFAIPPFSFLDARQGYWQDRKRLWIRVGIRSELGRGEDGTEHASTPAAVGQGKGLSETLAPRKGNNLLGMSEATDAYRQGKGTYGKGKADARAFGLDMMRGEGADRYTYVKGKDRYGTDTTVERVRANDDVVPTGMGPPVYSDGAVNPYLARSRRTDDDEDEVAVMGTSIFDPVLTELMYCWFSPPGGKVLDPFAGGSVRGIVAAALGRHYTGIDLRPEQVAANEQQWETIGAKLDLPGTSRWVTGDGRDVATLAADNAPYDFILTCPPYFDLERYSYDPADLSNAGTYKEFIVAFRDVIAAACGLLAPNRFAAVVVGDIRDAQGYYRNFPSHTISLFQKYGGMTLYNEAILVTAVGSLPVRIGKQFEAGRKLGKTHQNILVFYKGDPKRIRAELGDIVMGHTEG